MENKRSIGVTILSWLFIISGTLAFFDYTNSNVTKNYYSNTYVFFGMIFAISFVICGLFLLRLKPIARKIAIILCLISITLIPLNATKLYKALKLNQNEYLDKKRQAIVSQYKPESQQKALENLEIVKKYNKNLRNLMVSLFILLFLLSNLAIIFFFTRPKIKEQFKQ